MNKLLMNKYYIYASFVISNVNYFSFCICCFFVLKMYHYFFCSCFQVEYELIDHVEYPFSTETKTDEWVTRDDAVNFIHSAARSGDYFNGSVNEIPLANVLLRVYKTCDSLEKLR